MILFAILSCFIFLADWVSKTAVRAFIPVGGEISILPFFSLTHVKNTGIAFGLFQNRNYLFAGIGLLLMGAIVRFAFVLRREDPLSSGILAVVLGGALGNIYDRLAYGQVTDFLDFFIGFYHWPAFNVADSAISVGVTLLLWRSLKRKNSEFGIRNSE